jgi:hypothetical protein
MKSCMTVNNFAKKLGFKNGGAYGFKGHLHALERSGAVLIQQGGYLGDSLHHPKLVVIKNLEAIQQHFGKADLLQKSSMPKWKRMKKCRHKDFSMVAVDREVHAKGKLIRFLILKCGYCEFYIRVIEVDGSIVKS